MKLQSFPLQLLDVDLTVCKLKDISEVDFTGAYVFLSVTADEISLVCEAGRVPGNALATEDGWKALKITGPLDFSLVGVIAKITNVLAQHNIPVFVISTYNTDYILVKSHMADESLRLLRSV